MANSITKGSRLIELTSIDSDYDIGDRVRLGFIRFNSGGADTCVIKEGDENGPELFRAVAGAADEEHVQHYYGVSCRPFLDVSAGSYSVGAKVVIGLR